MDIETIREEMKVLNVNSGMLGELWFSRPREIIKRFEYLLAELDKREKIEDQQTRDYIKQREIISRLKNRNAELSRERGDTAENEISNRDSQIKALKQIIKTQHKDLERKMILDMVNPEGIDYETLNKNQAKVIHDQQEEIKQIESMHEKKIGEYEIFFESLKGILDKTRPIAMNPLGIIGHG